MSPTILGGVIGPGFLIRFLHYLGKLGPRRAKSKKVRSPTQRRLRLRVNGAAWAKYLRVHVGSCQNYGPFLGTLNKRCRIIIGTQKGTIILTTTHVLIEYISIWVVL